MWILTREINQYDQDGEYFVAGWAEKPTVIQLNTLFGDRWLPKTEHASYASYLVITGGGRIAVEDEWYNLFEYVEGTPYPSRFE